MATVRERLMGSDNGWVPLDLTLLRPGLERCKSNAQRAVLLILFAIWQEQQRKREPTWEFPASSRTVTSRLGLRPSQRQQVQDHISALIELGAVTVVEPARPRHARVLSLQSSLDLAGKTGREGNSAGKPAEFDGTRQENRPSGGVLGREPGRVDGQLGRKTGLPLRSSAPSEQSKSFGRDAAPASSAEQGPAADAAGKRAAAYGDWTEVPGVLQGALLADKLGRLGKGAARSLGPDALEACNALRLGKGLEPLEVT